MLEVDPLMYTTVCLYGSAFLYTNKTCISLYATQIFYDGSFDCCDPFPFYDTM